MVYTEFAKVKNVLTVNTKFGKRRVCNVVTEQGDEAIWAEDLSAFKHIKAGQQIQVIRGTKGNLTILERSAPAPQEPPRNVNGNGLHHISESLEQIVDDLLTDEDLPVFSDADKRRIMKYIKSQAKLLKYCHDTVCEIFPEILINDPRGARSLAVTLLISANTRISKSI
ncbi:hypothetical protein [Myxosarcina sp. GI1(2024)]